MMSSKQRLSARILVLVLCSAAVIPLATAARAECNSTFDDPLRKTPAGDTVCGPKTPTPTPTPTPKPTPTSTPTHPAGGGGTLPPPTTVPVFNFPVTNPFTNGFPVIPGQTTPTQTTTQQQTPFFPSSLFGNTQPGLAGHPVGSESGFFTEVAILLLLAVAVAMWLWRGRVRRWMIGV